MTRRPLLAPLLLILIFALALGLRLYDLTDPPLDFNPTRQLRSAIIARGIYYASLPSADSQTRELALSHWYALERLDPPILERLVAFTYRLMGNEQLWVVRVYTIGFWLAGGGALFALALRFASSWGALVGLGYYLFLPLGVFASRAFQPDPGMVAAVLFAALAFYRWHETRSWKWAIAAGLLGGLAALVKVVAAFFVGGMAVAVIANRESRIENWKTMIKNPQVWALGLLMVGPAAAYYLGGTGGESASYLANWTILSRWRDVFTPSFYMRWLILAHNLLGLPVVVAGLVGMLLAQGRARALLAGLWVGYGLYGIFFPYHILTHDYYHLPLVAIVGLSLAPLSGLVVEQAAAQGRLARLVLAGVGLLSVMYPAWISRSILVGQDFRDAPGYWQQVGEAFPADEKAIGVTQDYGFRLMYYGWRKIELLTRGTVAEFEEKAPGARFFVVTAKNQLTAALATYLAGHFPVYAQGGGYTIYDLQP